MAEQVAADLFDGMDDETFRDFVASRLGPDEPKRLWDALLTPDMLPRTKEALIQIQGQINSQVGTRRAQFKTLQLEYMAVGDSALADFAATKADHDDWLRRVGGYRRLLERRIRALRPAEMAARRQAHEEHQVRNRDQHRVIATKLSLAIHKHRGTSLGLDIKPEPHDLELWRLLGELTIEMNRREVSLAEAIEYGYWSSGEVASDG